MTKLKIALCLFAGAGLGLSLSLAPALWSGEWDTDSGACRAQRAAWQCEQVWLQTMGED